MSLDLAITEYHIWALWDVLGTDRDSEPDYNGCIDSLDAAREAVRIMEAAIMAPPAPPPPAPEPATITLTITPRED